MALYLDSSERHLTAQDGRNRPVNGPILKAPSHRRPLAVPFALGADKCWISKVLAEALRRAAGATHARLARYRCLR
jgi:hypothetical protein